MKTRSGSFLIAATLAATVALAACNKTAELPVAPAAPAAATVNVTDVDITEHAKTALHQNDLLKSFDISVVALKGDVRLIGVIDSQSQIDEAIKIARASDGVHSVHDELTLKK